MTVVEAAGAKTGSEGPEAGRSEDDGRVGECTTFVDADTFATNPRDVLALAALGEREREREPRSMITKALNFSLLLPNCDQSAKTTAIHHH